MRNYKTLCLHELKQEEQCRESFELSVHEHRSTMVVIL